MVVRLGVLRQIISRNLDDTAWLLPKLPTLWLFLLGHVVPPVVVIHRVRIHPDPVPRRATITLGGIPANPVREAVYDRFGQFSGLVDPCTRELQRQELTHVFRLIERQEDDLTVDAGSVTAGGQSYVMRNRWRPE